MMIIMIIIITILTLVIFSIISIYTFRLLHNNNKKNDVVVTRCGFLKLLSYEYLVGLYLFFYEMSFSCQKFNCTY